MMPISLSIPPLGASSSDQDSQGYSSILRNLNLNLTWSVDVWMRPSFSHSPGTAHFALSLTVLAPVRLSAHHERLLLAGTLPASTLAGFDHRVLLCSTCTVLADPSAMMYAKAFKWVLEDHPYVGFSLSLSLLLQVASLGLG